MGIGGPFPAMLKACAPRQKIAKAIGTQSPMRNMLAGLCRCVVALDMSVFMTAAAKSDRGAEEFHQDPPVPAKLLAKVLILGGLRMLFGSLGSERVLPHRSARSELSDAPRMSSVPWPALEL